MRCLGGLHGAGMLTCGDETVARAGYDFDGFLSKLGRVTGCGEIRTSGSPVPGFCFLPWRKHVEANRSGAIKSLIRGLAVNLTWRKLIVCVENNYRRKT